MRDEGPDMILIAFFAVVLIMLVAVVGLLAFWVMDLVHDNLLHGSLT